MTQISAEPTVRATFAPFGIRLGAYLIDSVCIAVVNMVVSFPLAFVPFGSLAALVLSFAWYAAFWRFAHATPGKLAVGLRIHPRSGPGRLSWWSILRRYLIQFGIPLALVTPFALQTAVGEEATRLLVWMLAMSAAGMLWTLLDSLWSLTNDAHQTLHDKAAGTVVVRWVV